MDDLTSFVYPPADPAEWLERVAASVVGRLNRDGLLNPWSFIEEEQVRAERAEAERDELRATVERVRALADELGDPNPEADQDWHDDPVGCIRDALCAALDGGEPK